MTDESEEEETDAEDAELEELTVEERLARLEQGLANVAQLFARVEATFQNIGVDMTRHGQAIEELARASGRIVVATEVPNPTKRPRLVT